MSQEPYYREIPFESPVPTELKIGALDDGSKKPGGASHVYLIHGLRNKHPSRDAQFPDEISETVDAAVYDNGAEGALMIFFQEGLVPEAGTNGVTIESLIAVLIDRLEGFQKGPFPSHHNTTAIYHLNAALDVLNARTSERVARGVEGKTVA